MDEIQSVGHELLQLITKPKGSGNFLAPFFL
jgi:hypothetical protein